MNDGEGVRKRSLLSRKKGEIRQELAQVSISQHSTAVPSKSTDHSHRCEEVAVAWWPVAFEIMYAKKTLPASICHAKSPSLGNYHLRYTSHTKCRLLTCPECKIHASRDIKLWYGHSCSLRQGARELHDAAATHPCPSADSDHHQVRVTWGNEEVLSPSHRKG